MTSRKNPMITSPGIAITIKLPMPVTIRYEERNFATTLPAAANGALLKSNNRCLDSRVALRLHLTRAYVTAAA